jgi:hypothetical protein
MPIDHWFLYRAIFLMAGIFVLGSIILSVYVSPLFLLFTGFVGGMLIIFSLTGFCPMAILFSKLGLKDK